MKKENYRLIEAEVLSIISNVLEDYDFKLDIKPSDYDGFYYVKFEKDYQFNWIARGIKDPNRLSGISINLNLNNPPDNDLRNKKGFLLKPGKFLKALIGDHNQISKIADKLAKALILLDKSKFSFEEFPSDIYALCHSNHGTIGSSCMRDQDPSFFYFYDDLAKGILYVYDKEKTELAGRALVWNALLLDQNGKVIKNHIIFLDRVYAASERLEEEFYLYAKDKGWFYRDFSSFTFYFNNERTNKIIARPANFLKEKIYYYYPYLDSFYLAEDPNTGNWYLVNFVPKGWKMLTEFTDTEGTNDFFHDFTYCKICDERIEEGEIFYYEGEPYCETCYFNNFDHCYYCEEACPTDETVLIMIDKYGSTVTACPNCANDDKLLTCSDCGQLLIKDAAYRYEDKIFCYHCARNFADLSNLFICPQCLTILPYNQTKTLISASAYDYSLHTKRICNNCLDKWEVKILTVSGAVSFFGHYYTYQYLLDYYVLPGTWFKVLRSNFTYKMESDLIYNFRRYNNLDRFYSETIKLKRINYLENLLKIFYKS